MDIGQFSPPPWLATWFVNDLLHKIICVEHFLFRWFSYTFKTSTYRLKYSLSQLKCPWFQDIEEFEDFKKRTIFNYNLVNLQEKYKNFKFNFGHVLLLKKVLSWVSSKIFMNLIIL